MNMQHPCLHPLPPSPFPLPPSPLPLPPALPHASRVQSLDAAKPLIKHAPGFEAPGQAATIAKEAACQGKKAAKSRHARSKTSGEVSDSIACDSVRRWVCALRRCATMAIRGGGGLEQAKFGTTRLCQMMLQYLTFRGHFSRRLF